MSVWRSSPTSGTMTVELMPSKAPNTVQNFLERVDESFYDGLIFHRVMFTFVIQRADSTST